MSRTESDKNARAGTLTGLVCGSLLFLALIISWTSPLPEIPPTEEGVEVNLGDGDLGSGEEQPLSPTPPATTEEAEISPPKAAEPSVADAREVETDDHDKEAPEAVVPKPTKPAEKKKPLTPPKEQAKPATKPTVKPVAVVKPTPAPKPKFVYTGGSNNQQGGNDADSWNKSQGEGISGGKGDQGRVGGNPASDSYQGGGSGRSGVSIQKGLAGRRITRYPSFEDDFNENAKVAVDIRVDANGNVISAVFQPKGSTTNDMAMRNIAVNKAKQLRFNVQPDGPEADLGTIVFNFKVR